MKTAVEAIFVGKGRLYNRRLMQMCSHYLVDPVARTPAPGRRPKSFTIADNCVVRGPHRIYEVIVVP
jgi:hypothetical protein